MACFISKHMPGSFHLHPNKQTEKQQLQSSQFLVFTIVQGRPLWDRKDVAADDERYGHPATSTTDQTIEKVTCGEKTPSSPQKNWTQRKPEQQLYQKYWQWAKYDNEIYSDFQQDD